MPLPQTFATTGFHAITSGEKITRYQVLGERSSGTNFVKRLLGRNSPLTPTEGLGWKHSFANMRAIPADLAVVCVVRDPVDWVRSMHAKPWHTTPAMQSLPFSDFIRSPWDTIIDRPRYFDGETETLGQPLQHDRDPMTGKRFDTLFALRTAKLRGLLSYLNRDCTCIVLRLETTVTAPQATLEQVAQTLGFTSPHDKFRPVMKRLGAKFKPSVDARPDTPKTLSQSDASFLKTELDLNLENSLGYCL
ncbi:hypothetical protein [Ascidiaceihabitans sp.]|uniref:hypothetical protein n=1 Tax=Ascidiaceihabitans sp. TaxID=1872644 RepID=UPI003297B8B6